MCSGSGDGPEAWHTYPLLGAHTCVHTPTPVCTPRSQKGMLLGKPGRALLCPLPHHRRTSGLWLGRSKAPPALGTIILVGAGGWAYQSGTGAKRKKGVLQGSPTSPLHQWCPTHPWAEPRICKGNGVLGTVAGIPQEETRPSGTDGASPRPVTHTWKHHESPSERTRGSTGT